MLLSSLECPKGSRKTKKRLGRGESSGLGKTSGKGHKGQKSRSGGNIPRGFEGGQMPLQRRLPKRGFHNRFKEYFSIVNLKDLGCFNEKDTIEPESLKNKGIIKSLKVRVKILGDGELSTSLRVKAHKFSASAKKKIEAAGGSIEVI